MSHYSEEIVIQRVLKSKAWVKIQVYVQRKFYKLLKDS